MKLLHQATPEGSAAACLATVFGLGNTEAVQKKLDNLEDLGLYVTDRVTAVLTEYGYTFSIKFPALDPWGSKEHDTKPAEAMHTAHIEKRGTYLAHVPTLNGEDDGHWVIVTKTEILDPSTKQRYIGADTSLEPYALIKLERPNYG
jgi:hypothetical protein